MLDIDALRLTDEEVDEVISKSWNLVVPEDIAKAQLAKALWGIQEWLTRGSADSHGLIRPRTLLTELNTQLLAAGMTRPKDGEC